MLLSKIWTLPNQGNSVIYLDIAQALCIWCPKQNKITRNFIILSEPHDITYSNILSLNLQVDTANKHKMSISQKLKQSKDDIYLIHEKEENK